MIELILAITLVDPKVDDGWIFGIDCHTKAIIINADHPSVIQGLSEQEWLQGYSNAVEAYNVQCAKVKGA